MRIATWNVNSLRVRLPHLLPWLEAVQPDIVALQETKVVDEEFPTLDLEQAGYHSVYSGQKSYNGVAILARAPAKEVAVELPEDQSEQRRFIAASYGDLRVVNVYIPNGASVDSDKYIYKLDWLVKLADYLTDQLRTYPRLLLVGDFNIAPENRDVHDPEAWFGKVLCTDSERSLFQRLLDLGLTDGYRLFETAGGNWSWWDYRMNAWKRDIGLRIDHILISNALKDKAQRCWIDNEPRGWERPSDHAPVIIDLK